MKYNIGNYSIEKFENENLKIDYKRSLKDYYYIIVYFIVSLPFLYFSQKFIYYLFEEYSITNITFNIILGYFFSFIILMFGLYFIYVSIATLIQPTKKVFYIDHHNNHLKIKKNLFIRSKFNFDEIKNFEIKAKDITIKNYHEGRTFKRQLFLIEMNLILKSSKTIKIHQFEKTNLMISFSEKSKNKSLKEISKQIASIIAQECNKEYYWKGTTKE